MAVLNVVKASITPAVSTLVAAAGGGDSFPNSGGGERFRVRNNDGSSKTVTIVAQNPAGCPAGTLHNIVLTVAAGAEQVVTGLARERFNDANGRVNVTYSAVTSTFVGVEL